MASTHWARGGNARAATLTSAERREIGQKASRVRWDKVRQRREHKQTILDAAAANQACYADLVQRITSGENIESVYAIFQQRQAKEQLLPGANPYKIAQDDPARRWSKSVHDLLVLMRSVRENAGGDITVLTRKWSRAARYSYRQQLQDIHITIDLWIHALAVEEE